MKRLHKSYIWIFTLALGLLLSTVWPEDALARRGFGGGRSFRSSRASSWGSSRSKAKSAWSKSKPKKLSSKRGSTKGALDSKTDRRLYEKAKANGTAYKTRADAKKAFENKYGQQYSSKFPTKPAQRPKYIPATTTINGRNVPIDYNPTYGGYGYFGAGGRWMMYSAMADAAMLGMLMSNHGYYYGAPPVYRSGFGSTFRTGIIVVLIIIGFAYFMRPRF